METFVSDSHLDFFYFYVSRSLDEVVHYVRSALCMLCSHYPAVSNWPPANVGVNLCTLHNALDGPHVSAHD